jgi:hypothetical protein
MTGLQMYFTGDDVTGAVRLVCTREECKVPGLFDTPKGFWRYWYRDLTTETSLSDATDAYNEHLLTHPPGDRDPALIQVRELSLSVRASNCLYRERINTVSDLLERTPEDLLDIRNFGYRSLVEVQMSLKDLGWKLKDDVML